MAVCQAFKPFRARTLRITELSDCCTPPEDGTENAIDIVDAFTTVSIAVDVEEGEELFEKKANGDVCISERDPDVLKALDVSITFCQVLPSTVSLLTGWPLVFDASGNAIGFDVMSGTNDRQVGLELWSGVSGIDCGEGARYGYAVIPCVGPFQLSENLEFGGIDTSFNVTVTGSTTDSHAWCEGPYAVQLGVDGQPGPLLDPIGQGTLARIMATDVPPPELGCSLTADATNGYVKPTCADVSPGSV